MRVSEIYASTQGEGPNVGKTTVFIRFGGCNLRCAGWACDTPHAIFPEYRKEWIRMTPEEVAQQASNIAEQTGATQITLTGGEPFLQPHEELLRLVVEQLRPGYDVDCFSNGTLLYPEWARVLQFIMDWKLPGSGEDYMSDNRLTNLWTLEKAARLHPANVQSVKFVCKDEDDFHTACNMWNDYLRDKNIRVYVGRVWNGEITDAKLAELVMENQLPWYLNVQLHNYIWPANERGR